MRSRRTLPAARFAKWSRPAPGIMALRLHMPDACWRYRETIPAARFESRESCTNSRPRRDPRGDWNRPVRSNRSGGRLCERDGRLLPRGRIRSGHPAWPCNDWREISNSCRSRMSSTFRSVTRRSFVALRRRSLRPCGRFASSESVRQKHRRTTCRRTAVRSSRPSPPGPSRMASPFTGRRAERIVDSPAGWGGRHRQRGRDDRRHRTIARERGNCCRAVGRGGSGGTSARQPTS